MPCASVATAGALSSGVKQGNPGLKNSSAPSRTKHIQKIRGSCLHDVLSKTPNDGDFSTSTGKSIAVFNAGKTSLLISSPNLSRCNLSLLLLGLPAMGMENKLISSLYKELLHVRRVLSLPLAFSFANLVAAIHSNLPSRTLCSLLIILLVSLWILFSSSMDFLKLLLCGMQIHEQC